MCIWLGLQHCLLCATSIALLPIVFGPSMCMFDDDVGYQAKIMFTSSLYFVSGISTILQCTLGSRLPIVQGTTFTLIAPVIAVLSLPHNECPNTNVGINNETGHFLYNDTNGDVVDGVELWQRRMREIQGSLSVASITEFLIGVTGATTFIVRFVGPMTIAPAIALIGLDLFAVAYHEAEGHWGIAMFVIFAVTLFSQYLNNVQVPIPWFDKKRKWHLKRTKPFGLFPVLVTIILAYVLCHILTVTNVLPDDPAVPGYAARTDTKSHVVQNSPWFYFPYPGHWGLPIVSGAGFVGMSVAVFAGIVESIGDYYACAKLVGAPPPPPHAVTRGIMMEGLGCVFAGFVSGSGTTSYSNNIAAIGITKVASRRVLIATGIILTLMGVFCKFGAIFVTIPTPIIGGIFCATFGMIGAVGISMLQFVDMNSPRNQYILGFSLFMGLVIPEWMKANPGSIETGAVFLNQTIAVLLETATFVGGFSAALLDNTVPGTLEERGIIAWKKSSGDATGDDDNFEVGKESYNLPFSTNWRFAKFFPIFPQFDKQIRFGEEEQNHNTEAAQLFDIDVETTC
ncbi:solute carrier family 23 member 2-like [Styela clava]